MIPPYMLHEKIVHSNNVPFIQHIYAAQNRTLSFALSSLFAASCAMLIGIFFTVTCCICRNRHAHRQRQDFTSVRYVERRRNVEEVIEEVLIVTEQQIRSDRKESPEENFE